MLNRSAWILCSFLVSSSALADEDRTESPHFLVQGDADTLPLKETRAKVAIAGTIAHVRVTQVYQNEGGQPLEAVYVFPGSTRAAVFGMEMRIGNRTIVAEIAETEKARKKYDKAKADGKSASLLEQKRPNVFQMNVANIMPGDRVEVRLDYTELLVPENGVYELVYPSVVGPRFTGESKKEQGWTQNPHLTSDKPPYRWSVEARIAAGLAVSGVKSPSHKIALSFAQSGQVDIQVVDEDGGNRDFVLRYRLDGEQIETGVMLYEGQGEKFFTAMIQPPKRVAPAMLPEREYIFVVDVSGSMNGFPIRTAKQLMRDLLKGLESQDRFNILAFAGGSRVLAERSLRATPGNISRADTFLAAMQGGGGTRILSALDRALAMKRFSDMSTSMVVITDGYVSVDDKVFQRIHDNLGEANLFAFGIGSSVNRNLIEGMARAGRGEPFVVLDPSMAALEAARFADYVKSPVLTNVAVELDGLDAYDVIPKHIPDLFGERPIIVMGKYRGAATGTIRISGTNGQGAFSRSLAVGDFRASDDLVALRYLWARDRIRELSDRMAVGSNQKDAITKLGLRYNLMSAFTSFVAVDNQVRNHGQEVRDRAAGAADAEGCRSEHGDQRGPRRAEGRRRQELRRGRRRHGHLGDRTRRRRLVRDVSDEPDAERRWLESDPWPVRGGDGLAEPQPDPAGDPPAHREGAALLREPAEAEPEPLREDRGELHHRQERSGHRRQDQELLDEEQGRGALPHRANEEDALPGRQRRRCGEGLLSLRLQSTVACPA